MPEAVEIAKLRLFLTLAARLERPEEIEPLPDLDFNIRTGNLLVGFRDLEDARSRVACDLVSENVVQALLPKALRLVAVRDAFIDAIEDAAGSDEVAILKHRLVEASDVLRQLADGVYFTAEGHGSPDDPAHEEAFVDWRDQSRPFHWFIEFPHVVERGGFDVVIGNPPYVATPSTVDLGYSRLGYLTRGAPDLYAVCVERAESLRRAPNGRFSMIVPLSASFSEDFATLRGVLREASDVIWWSTYSRLPDGLFAGNARIRNTIVCTHGPFGAAKKEWVTRHHVWASAFRPHLFSTIEYFESQPDAVSAAPLRAGRALATVAAILALPRRALAGDAEVLFRPTGQYWTPVLPGPVPMVDGAGRPIRLDPGLHTFASVDSRRLAIAVCVCAGNVGYSWWSAWGDDFHFTRGVMAGLLERVLPVVEDDVDLSCKASAVVARAWDSAFYTMNAGNGYVNIRYPDVRAELAEFDELLLDRLGVDDSVFRDLQIWYRQVMRGWEPGPKSRSLPAELVDVLRTGQAAW